MITMLRNEKTTLSLKVTPPSVQKHNYFMNVIATLVTCRTAIAKLDRGQKIKVWNSEMEFGT